MELFGAVLSTADLQDLSQALLDAGDWPVVEWDEAHVREAWEDYLRAEGREDEIPTEEEE